MMFNRCKIETSLKAEEIDKLIQFLINNKQIPVENFLGYVIPFDEFSGKSSDKEFIINADIKGYKRVVRFEAVGTIYNMLLYNEVGIHIKYSLWGLIFSFVFIFIWLLNYTGNLPIEIPDNNFLRFLASRKMLPIVLVWLAFNEVIKCVRINKLKKLFMALFDNSKDGH